MARRFLPGECAGERQVLGGVVGRRTWLPAALAAEPVPFANVDRDGIAEQVIPSLRKVWPTWLIFAVAAAALLFFGHRWLAGGTARGLGRHEVPSGRQAAPPATARGGKKEQHLAQRAEKLDERRAAGPARSTQTASVIRSFLEPPGPHGRWWGLTRVLFLLIALFWAAMFLHNSPYLAPDCGFDAEGQLAYINHFRTAWSVPLAGQGWQTHHPPLYHFLAGVLLRLVGYAADTSRGILTIRLLNLVLGLSNVFIILACLRLIFPEHPRRWVLGLLMAGFLPMYVYAYQYPTNHILAGPLASLTIYSVLRILCVSVVGVRDYVFLGLALGFALLSVVSVSLLVVPVGVALWPNSMSTAAQLGRSPTRSAFFCWPWSPSSSVAGTSFMFGPISARRWLPIRVRGSVRRGPGGRTLGSARGAITSALASHYVLPSTVFGTACGMVFTRPYGATAPSAARRSSDSRPPWSYDYLVAGMSLALLPTAAILLGSVAAILRFLRKPTILWLFLLAVAFSIAMFVGYFPVLLPYSGPTKASYGLAGGVPLCVLAALGLDLLSGPRRWLRGVIFTILGVWIFNTAASYWISPAAAETRRYVARQPADAGDLAEASRKLEQLLADCPEDTLTRVLWRNSTCKGISSTAPGKCSNFRPASAIYVRATFCWAFYWPKPDAGMMRVANFRRP